MYSVIETGGFQHKVRLGETIKISKLDGEVGTDITLSEVYLLINGDDIKIGTPVLSDASVKVEILAQGKADKIKVFKKKRRIGYRRTQGHRQEYTEVIVKEMVSGDEINEADKNVLARARARATALLKQKAPTISLKNTAKTKESVEED